MNDSTQRVRAFLSSPYGDKSQHIVAPIRELITSCGIEPYEINKSGKSGDLSEAIINGIRRCDMFIAVVVLDEETQARYTRPWLVSEIGLASALKKNIVIFQDERVDHIHLGVGLNQITEKFQHENPVRNETIIRTRLLEAVAEVSEEVRLVRNGNLAERTYEVKRQRLVGNIRVRELSSAKDGWMSQDLYMRGCEILCEQFTRTKSFPIHLWIGVNAVGINIASYIDGQRDTRKAQRIPFGIIKSGPEDPVTHEREYDFVLPAKKRILNQAGKTSLGIMVVDSQIKSGRSQEKIRIEINKYFDNSPQIYFAVLIANGVESPTNTGPLGMEELFDPMSKINKEGLTPDFLAYISAPNIKPPDGMP